jgi:acyl-CoA dehydrogenase
MQQKLDAARLLTWKSAWEIDKMKGESHSPSVAKLYALAWELVNDAMQVFGGYGYTQMVPIEKLFRDIRVLKIYEITGEIQRIILAGAVMSASKRVRQPAGDADSDQAEITPPGRYGLLARHCQTCGNVYYGKKSHSDCPYCFSPKEIFTEQSDEALDKPIKYHEMGKGKQKPGWTNRMKQTSVKQTNKT